MNNLVEIIKSTRGKIFSVEFTKRSDGSSRKMLCRTGVSKYTKGVGMSYNSEDKGLITVYSLQDRGYRTIPQEGIKKVKFGGKIYEGE